MRLDAFDYFRKAGRGDVGVMASYETDDRRIVLVESAAVAVPVGHGPAVVPWNYMRRLQKHGSGLMPLHDGDDATGWRPLLYTLKFDTTERAGSQMELDHRAGLHEIDRRRRLLLAAWRAFEATLREQLRPEDRDYDRKELMGEWLASLPDDELPANEWHEAVKRAQALLVERLSPQQLLEYRAHGEFHVRGTINPLYLVQPGNGVAIVNPLTLETRVNLCLHTDEWIPHEDNALAAKLLIESGLEGEKQLLEAAQRFPRQARLRPLANDRMVWGRHRELLPGPQEIVECHPRYKAVVKPDQ